MITEIGLVAGDILSYLEKQGEVNFSDLLRDLDKPRDKVLMSLGWLAREKHIILKEEDGDYSITLRK